MQCDAASHWPVPNATALSRQDQGAIFGRKITTSSFGPACWMAAPPHVFLGVPLACLWCASACLRRLLFSRRLGQDVWRQALSRLIRRRPSAGWAARRCPPAGGSTESSGWTVHVYYIWSRSAGFVARALA